jgi:hypothetical protein
MNLRIFWQSFIIIWYPSGWSFELWLSKALEGLPIQRLILIRVAVKLFLCLSKIKIGILLRFILKSIIRESWWHLGNVFSHRHWHDISPIKNHLIIFQVIEIVLQYKIPDCSIHPEIESSWIKAVYKLYDYFWVFSK